MAGMAPRWTNDPFLGRGAGRSRKGRECGWGREPREVSALVALGVFPTPVVGSQGGTDSTEVLGWVSAPRTSSCTCPLRLPQVWLLSCLPQITGARKVQLFRPSPTAVSLPGPGPALLSQSQDKQGVRGRASHDTPPLPRCPAPLTPSRPLIHTRCIPCGKRRTEARNSTRDERGWGGHWRKQTLIEL